MTILIFGVCLTFTPLGIYFTLQHEVEMFVFAQLLANSISKHQQVTLLCMVFSEDSRPHICLYCTMTVNLRTTFPRALCQLVLVSANRRQSQRISRWEKCKSSFSAVTTVSEGMQTPRLLITPPSLFSSPSRGSVPLWAI